MSIKVAKSLVQMVIFIMTFECITAVFAQAESGDIHHTTVQSKSSSTSAFLSIISEKTEEEERSEEERDKFGSSIELADFSKIAIFLSKVHTPQVYFVPYKHRFDQPSLFMLHCVFLI
jgi:hypothetical protein